MWKLHKSQNLKPPGQFFRTLQALVPGAAWVGRANLGRPITKVIIQCPSEMRVKRREYSLWRPMIIKTLMISSKRESIGPKNLRDISGIGHILTRFRQIIQETHLNKLSFLILDPIRFLEEDIQWALQVFFRTMARNLVSPRARTSREFKILKG